MCNRLDLWSYWRTVTLKPCSLFAPRHLPLHCADLLACLIMTFSPLLFEMQHPVWDFAARSTHDIDNGSELPGVILCIECDSLSCSKACTATPQAPLGVFLRLVLQTNLELMPILCSCMCINNCSFQQTVRKRRKPESLPDPTAQHAYRVGRI